MKTIFYAFILILSASFFTACDETDDLWKNLTEGKIALKVGSAQETETLNCVFYDYGGEVFIEAKSATGEQMLNIMYGHWQNTTPLAVKTYFTSKESDMMYVTSIYGNSDVNSNPGAVVTIKITKITENVIEGELSGKVLSNSNQLVDIKAAFKAKKEIPT